MKNIGIMKNNEIKYNLSVYFVCFLLLVTHSTVKAQTNSVPIPDYSFPLIGGNPSHYQEGSVNRQGVKSGELKPAKDRFGNDNGATEFSHGSYIEQGNDNKYILNGAVTVSFWVKQETSNEYPSGFSPYTPGVTTKKRFFSLSEDFKSGGMAKISNSALLGQERTVVVKNTNVENIKPWYLWLYKPVLMDEAGWYHIVMISDVNFTRIHVFKPSGDKGCTFNYMGNDFSKRFVIGKKASYHHTVEKVEAATIMDDFKVWNRVLTDDEIYSLHDSESIFNQPINNNISGTYYVTSFDRNHQSICVSKKENSNQVWMNNQDFNGNISYNICDLVTLTKEEIDGNFFNLKLNSAGKDMYLDVGGNYQKTYYDEEPTVSHSLVTKNEKTVVQIYNLNHKHDGDHNHILGIKNMADKGLASSSFPLYLKAVDDGKISSSNELGTTGIHSPKAVSIVNLEVAIPIAAVAATGITIAVIKNRKFITRAIRNCCRRRSVRTRFDTGTSDEKIELVEVERDCK